LVAFSIATGWIGFRWNTFNVCDVTNA
jgi:hypothetical protein